MLLRRGVSVAVTGANSVRDRARARRGVVQLALNPLHQVRNVLRRAALQRLAHAHAVRPPVLILGPGAHHGARRVRAVLAQRSVQERHGVEKVDSVHGEPAGDDAAGDRSAGLTVRDGAALMRATRCGLRPAEAAPANEQAYSGAAHTKAPRDVGGPRCASRCLLRRAAASCCVPRRAGCPSPASPECAQ